MDSWQFLNRDSEGTENRFFILTVKIPRGLPWGGFNWLGILFCLSQSAIFSGMNLAAFSISRLRLEVQVAAGNSSPKMLWR